MQLVPYIVLGLASGAAFAQDSALLTRGKYLMEGVVACANCHMARNNRGQPLFEKGLSGGMEFDDPAFKAYAPNITPDPETGIGKWTDAQLAKAIREGIRPDGSVIGPPMPIPFYRYISDNDLAAIIAYLRAQPAVKSEVPKTKYNIPLPPNYGPAVQAVSTPPATDAISYGRYLANIGHCMECHTPRDKKGMLVLAKLGAGGQTFKGPWGESISPNLTPDRSGLKSWSDAQIAQAIRTGVDKNGRHLNPPMAFDWYKNINDADITSLIAYLRALSPRSSGEQK
jgi:mono/diheme cytochrome c family protein